MKMKFLCVSNPSTILSYGYGRKKPCTQSFFNWDLGRSKNPEPIYYDDIALPFPPSLVSKTFLKGNIFISSFLKYFIFYFQNCMVEKEI